MQKLRYRLKQEITAVFQVLLNTHHSKLTGPQEAVIATLEECQQAALVVGNKLEAVLEDQEEMVAILEEYCEELYQAALNPERAEDHTERLDSLVQAVRERLEPVETYLQIVFMPYKSSMWDSLESIYLAARKDQECECLVVPIPYYKMDQNRRRAELVYEGNDFPKDIPITDYREYRLESALPDVIYVHNPYDEYNVVTNIHPDYFSERLKKFTGCLVYVPYYVTAGFFSEGHRSLSVYRNMDYMIAQSEHFKEEAKGQPYYEKMLPLGSPKLDRVIRVCREGRPLPEAWREQLKGRKIVMLNTSINTMLWDTEGYLDKLDCLFRYFKTRKDVGLIWRPHPLLASTIASIRPAHEKRFGELVDYFKTNQVGVLDETPDLTATIAVSDAYIGENATSVINLFGAAGKPIFILNNYISAPFAAQEKRRLFAADMAPAEDGWRLLTGQGIFRVQAENWENAEYLGQVPGAPLWTIAYNGMAALDGRWYLAPLMSRRMAAFLPEAGGEGAEAGPGAAGQPPYALIDGPETSVDYKFRKVIAWGRKLFFLPQDHPAILEYNLSTGKWREHGDCILKWRAGAPDSRYEDVYDGAVVGSQLWMTASYSNLLLHMDLDTGEYRFLELGQKGLGYSGIAADRERIWAAEVHTGTVIRVDLRTRKAEAISMPKGFASRPSVYGRSLAHVALASVGEWIVTAPGFSNSMVKIHKKSGKAYLLAPEEWAAAGEPANGYSPKVNTAAYFMKALDRERVMVSRLWDGALLEVNAAKNTVRTYHPGMSEESLGRLEAMGDGFEKIDTVAEFSRKESAFFSLEGFLDDLTAGRLEGVGERQKEALKTLAANLDGTCGEKVHECIKEKCKC